MRDAVVIGARCAGATTALVLARRGLDVLLVDRAAFPSEIPHGHFIHQSGPARLAELGLLDRVLGTGCPAVTTIATDFGDGPLTGRGIVRDGVPFGLGPRRGPLDRVLVEAAAAAGAEVRERFAVDELVADRDRVVGVRGREVIGRRRGRLALVAGRGCAGELDEADAPKRRSGVRRWITGWCQPCERALRRSPHNRPCQACGTS
jgi:flavin-dependent dehydrogenase